MESNQPIVAKETWGDIVERQLQPVRHNRKKKVSFKTWLEQQAVIDQKISTETQDISMAEKEGDQTAPSEKESYSKNTDNQTSENVQKENLTEVSDNHTPDSTQEESFTEVSSNQSSEDANRYCNQHPAQLYPQPHPIGPQSSPHAGYESQRYHDSQNLVPMPYFWLNSPLLVKGMHDFQQHVHYLLSVVQENSKALSEQTEKRLSAEKQYNDCLKQLRLHEEINLQLNLKLNHQENMLKKPYNDCLKQLRLYEDINLQLNLKLNHQENMLKKQYDDCLKQFRLYEDINLELNVKLNHQENMLKNIVSEQRQAKKQMVSVQIQTDLQVTSNQKTVNYQAVSTETEMDVQEIKCQFKAVHRTISTQTEMDVQETKCQINSVHQTISTQTETDLLVNVEEENVTKTQLNEDQQGQSKPSKKCNGKNRGKAAMEAVAESETLNNQKVSGENIEEQEGLIPQIVEDQTVSLKNEICTNEMEVTEEGKVTDKKQNGDQQVEIKPSKKSKRKDRRNRRKAPMEAVSEPDTLNNQKVCGENIKEQEGLIPEIVEDQTASLKNEICTNEMVISQPQKVTEEEKANETQQNGDQQVEIKPSKKSKRKERRNRRKAAMEAVSEPETLNNQKICGENIEEQEGSILEKVEDQTASLKNEICTNEMVISQPQKVTGEEKAIETQQNGDQEVEIKPSQKFKHKDRGNRRKAAMEAVSEPETLNNQKVSGENIEEQEGSILEKVDDQTASLKKEICSNETVISKRQQVTEEEKATETQLNQNQNEGPVKMVSMWRKLKKAMTPSHRRQYKDKRENHHQ